MFVIVYRYRETCEASLYKKAQQLNQLKKMNTKKIVLSLIASLSLSGAFGGVLFAEKPASAKPAIAAEAPSPEARHEGKGKHHGHHKHHHHHHRHHKKSSDK